MKVQVTAGKLIGVRADALGVCLFQGAKRPEGDLAALDKALGGLIARILKDGDFEGKAAQTALLYPSAPVRAKRLCLVGLGKREEFTLEGFRKAVGLLAKLARRVAARSLAVSIHGAEALEETRADAARAAVEAAILATYSFDEYKTDADKGKKPLANLTVVSPDRRGLKAVRAAAAEGLTIAEATCFARRLVDLPGNTHTPTYLAREARAIARSSQKLKVRVLGRAQMERLKMGALLGVAKGSLEPPRFIIMEYKGGRAREAPVVLVGKAVTFDSGGISIKPSQAMEEMKRDMAGGAAVMGALKAISALKLPINVVGLIPATENLPSGTALKP
ncbi:MAG: M17 family peptidase N-terminal domain-containing protein, partial [bacterium]